MEYYKELLEMKVRIKDLLQLANEKFKDKEGQYNTCHAEELRVIELECEKILKKIFDFIDETDYNINSM